MTALCQPPTPRRRSAFRRTLFGAAVVLLAFGIVTRETVTLAGLTPAPHMDQLWQTPDDLASRDLFAGPGGLDLAPAATSFVFLGRKTSGVSLGYDVRDPAGRKWSAKLGPEAQSEVTVSRLLWAMGFHQPPTYYVPSWTMTGPAGGPQAGARFRPDVEDWTAGDEWSWYENPFRHTRPFKGLIAAQMLLGNWDLKPSNNRIYLREGSEERRYVVRDLGASLGSSRQHRFFAILNTPGHQGTKNDIEGFERQRLLRDVDGTQVSFDYRGLNRPLLEDVSAMDVRWACERLDALSERQWQDAFRAGGYDDALAGRFIRKIREKIAEGLALPAAPPSTR